MPSQTSPEQPSQANASAFCCKICGYMTDCPDPRELGEARGNTERFRDTRFRLWKCPKCLSIHSIDPVDFRDLYADYPLSRRRLDVFAKGTIKSLLGRLVRAGLSRSDSILDYGSGHGIFVDYLQQRGYRDVTGYDPYVPAYAERPYRLFDCVVANDVIEHVPDPRATLKECADLVKPGGILYLGTADSEPVEMDNLEPHLMRLHQPFHRVIITEKSLHELGLETGFSIERTYRRSYMDTLMPFSNYRFLDEFNKALGHNLDRAFDPDAGKVVLSKPRLLFHALFGYFFPSAYEPAIILRRPQQSIGGTLDV
jgi:SAM-dependent methyltransferase